MNRGDLRRVLVLVPGALSGRLAGPEIRAWELAKGLSRGYEVTVAAQGGADGEREGISVIDSGRATLLRAAGRHDALMATCLPPYLLAAHKPRGMLAIADLYDPHEQELATLPPGRTREHELRVRAAVQAIQLRHADLVLCAGERQRSQLVSDARRLLGPRAPAPDPIVVPFGISDPTPPSGRRPLHEHLPELREGDKLVLWWGSVWRWLDAETAIRAFAGIAATRTDIKLVVTAGRPPNDRSTRKFDDTEAARALASALGVLGRTVFFYEDWIPYEERHDYLREADLGITLHRHAEEARLAARARYMDYLSAGLPCVLGRGDDTAAELEEGGFATLLDVPTPERLAAVLVGLLDDPAGLARARLAGRRLTGEHRWSAVGARLRAALAAAPRPARGMRQAALLGGAGTYYARRLYGKLAPLS